VVAGHNRKKNRGVAPFLTRRHATTPQERSALWDPVRGYSFLWLLSRPICTDRPLLQGFVESQQPIWADFTLTRLSLSVGHCSPLCHPGPRQPARPPSHARCR
jgi:hypothetical protein